MKQRVVSWSPQARADLLHIHRYISDAGSPVNALRFVERIAGFCDSFDVASERGHRRDDIRPGLRIIGFERRVTIAFAVDEGSVTIIRVFYGGADWEGAL